MIAGKASSFGASVAGATKMGGLYNTWRLNRRTSAEARKGNVDADDRREATLAVRSDAAASWAHRALLVHLPGGGQRVRRL